MKWWKRLVPRSKPEGDLEKELRFHLEQQTNDFISEGQTPLEAKRRARLAMGGTEQIKEDCRDERGSLWLENILLDLRYAVRAYRRSPGFTFTALAAIAVGIGATSAVFSVTDRILFRHLPYQNDDQLVSLGMLARVVDDGEFLFAGDYKMLQNSNTPLQSITSWSGVNDCDVTEQNPLRQRCAEVDSNFLEVLGIRPIVGQTFTPSDVRPDAPRTVMLSYGAWQGHFGADRNVAGRLVLLDGQPARVRGVLPASFELPTLQHADLLVPQIILPAAYRPGATRVLRVIARLKTGVTLPSARRQLDVYFDRMMSEMPPQFRKEVQFRVRTMRDRQMGGAQLAAWALLGAALTMMLISCASVANLLLARMAARQTEISIRNAIGISRGRLLSQLLTESLVLAAAGGVIGCALGALLLRALVSVNPYGLPHLADAALDIRVLVFSLSLSLLVGVLFGLAPAFQELSAKALGASRGVALRTSTALKNTLVVVQIALSLVLLSSSGLLVRSLWNLETQSLGMQSDQVLTAQLVLPANRYTKPQEKIAFFNAVERELGAIPGIRAAGISDSLPPAGWERSRPLSTLPVVGRPGKFSGVGGLVNWRYVSPEYFSALHIPVMAGRTFREDDRLRGSNLCILSQSLALRLFPSGDAVGHHLKIGENSPDFGIAGIVPDVKNTALATASNPEYYILRTHSADFTYLNATGPVAQRTLSIVIRSSGGSGELATQLRQRVASLDATLPVQIETMPERLSDLAAGPRFYALLLIAFAATGLLLAGVGLYGTVSYLVSQRTHEIGIRMALGATPDSIRRLVLTYTVKWTLVGGAIGVFAAMISSGMLASLLFRVPARDPITIVASLAFLMLATWLASLAPVHRATHVDPVKALRTENS